MYKCTVYIGTWYRKYIQLWDHNNNVLKYFSGEVITFFHNTSHDILYYLLQYRLESGGLFFFIKEYH